jgi:4-amino-4-deoxy-L-arabinose transferase-like glycosyltransferase
MALKHPQRLIQSIIGFFRKYQLEAIIFFATAAIKLIISFIVLSYNGQSIISSGDASGYLAIAQSIASGAGFSAHGYLDAKRTPLYPLFLSLFYLLHIPIVILPAVQIMMLSFASVLIYRSASMMFSKKAGLIAVTLFSLEPLMIIYANMALTESLFILLFVGSVCVFLNYIYREQKTAFLIFSAILVGLTALTRPIAMYYPLAVILIILLKWSLDTKPLRSAVRPCLIFCAFFFITVFPWFLRNTIAFGHFSMSNYGPQEVYNERVPIVIAAKQHISYNDAFILNQQNLKRLIPNFDPQVYEHTFAYNGIVSVESRRIILSDLPDIIKFHLIAAVSFFETTGYDSIFQYFGIENGATRTNFTELLFEHKFGSFVKSIFSLDLYSVIRVLGYAAWFILNVAIVLAIIVSLRRSLKNLFAILFVAVIVLYFSVFSIGPLTQARYRIPTYPFLFILVGFAATTLIPALKNFEE